MKRITFDGLFCDIATCHFTPGGSYCESGTCSQRQVWERLKAIEDILGDEYDLDRLREMVQAEKDGRLVALPCKVGSTVYHTSALRGVVEATVRTFWVKNGGVEMIRTTSYDVPFDHFGKSLFLTREEAEAALSAQKGDAQ